ncbi:MAG: PEGA domain-containing protein [Polyangiales bacterium]
MRLALVAMVLCVACRQSAPPTTSLRFTPAAEAPKHARVVVDDQPLGSLDFVVKRGVALPPGKHRITIEADGYLPWDQEVDAGDSGGLIKLDVKLIKRPD